MGRLFYVSLVQASPLKGISCYLELCSFHGSRCVPRHQSFLFYKEVCQNRHKLGKRDSQELWEIHNSSLGYSHAMQFSLSLMALIANVQNLVGLPSRNKNNAKRQRATLQTLNCNSPQCLPTERNTKSDKLVVPSGRLHLVYPWFVDVHTSQILCMSKDWEIHRWMPIFILLGFGLRVISDGSWS